MYKKLKKQAVSNQYFDSSQFFGDHAAFLNPLQCGPQVYSQAVCCRMHARPFGKYAFYEHGQHRHIEHVHNIPLAIIYHAGSDPVEPFTRSVGSARIDIAMPKRTADSHRLMAVSPYLGLISAVHSTTPKHMHGQVDTGVQTHTCSVHPHPRQYPHVQSKHTALT